MPMVPLDHVLHGNTPAPTFHPFLGMRPSSHGLIRDCQAIPGLARVNGHPPFPMQQGSPLQHYTMVYSMRSNRQLPRKQLGPAMRPSGEQRWEPVPSSPRPMLLDKHSLSVFWCRVLACCVVSCFVPWCGLMSCRAVSCRVVWCRCGVVCCGVGVMWCCVPVCRVVLCCVVFCSVALCCVALCCVVLCCVVLRCIVL